MPYRLVGSDLDFIHILATSATHRGVEHNIGICKRHGTIYCTCHDALCRRKIGHILAPALPACKHVQGLHVEIGRLLEAS